MRNFLYNNSVIDVYMDLLFKTGEYEKVVRTYEEIDYFNEQKLTNHMTLVMAALYNLVSILLHFTFKIKSTAYEAFNVHTY